MSPGVEGGMRRGGNKGQVLCKLVVQAMAHLLTIKRPAQLPSSQGTFVVYSDPSDPNRRLELIS